MFGGREGDGGDCEAAPVHVDGRGVAVYVGGAEGVDVLAVLAVAGEGFNAGGRMEEGLRGRKLTVRHRRLKYSHKRSLMSPPKLLNKSRSRYCAE